MGIEPTTSGLDLPFLPTELRGRTEKVGDDLDGESRRRESKGTYECYAAYSCSTKAYVTISGSLKVSGKPLDFKEARKGIFVDVVFAKRLKITKKDI